MSKKDVKYLRDVAIPTLRAMKNRTQECRKRLEQLKRERMRIITK
jgi:hypothetical protein